VTDSVREWLPAGAFTTETLRAALAPPVEEWALCWFGAAAAWIAEGGHGGAQTTSVSGAARGARVVLDGPGRRALLELALAVELGGASLNELDRRLLDAVADRLVEDLLERVERHLGDPAAAHRGQPEASVRLASRAGDMGFLHVAAGALVPLLKRRMARYLPVGTLGDRRRTLEAVPVAVEAVLGRVELTVDELDGLAVGDVLVLDRALDAPVDLRVGACGAPLGAGRLKKDQGRVAVHL
jgi:flagellar motor switch/type III secretory pathway protein FliN